MHSQWRRLSQMQLAVGTFHSFPAQTGPAPNSACPGLLFYRPIPTYLHLSPQMPSAATGIIEQWRSKTQKQSKAKKGVCQSLFLFYKWGPCEGVLTSGLHKARKWEPRPDATHPGSQTDANRFPSLFTLKRKQRPRGRSPPAQDSQLGQMRASVEIELTAHMSPYCTHFPPSAGLKVSLPGGPTTHPRAGRHTLLCRQRA